MGSVRLVLDRNLNRRLATKIIHPKLFSPIRSRSLLEEAQVVPSFSIPISSPFTTWELARWRFYFTMKEIKGRSLGTVSDPHAAVKNGRLVATNIWNFRRLINVFYKVCQAVGYAHSKGFASRLKPENIMLGEFGEFSSLTGGLQK